MEDWKLHFTQQFLNQEALKPSVTRAIYTQCAQSLVTPFSSTKLNNESWHTGNLSKSANIQLLLILAHPSLRHIYQNTSKNLMCLLVAFFCRDEDEINLFYCHFHGLLTSWMTWHSSCVRASIFPWSFFNFPGDAWKGQFFCVKLFSEKI